MNRSMFLVLSALFISTAVSADIQMSPTLPNGSQGSVTLNWQKFNEIWTQLDKQQKRIHDLEHPDSSAPVPFTITKAAYRGTVAAKKVEMQGIFEIDVFDRKNWVKIPFMPSSVAIQNVLLDGAPVGVLQENNSHELLLKNPGRHILSVRFSLQAPENDQAPQLHLDIASTPMTVLAMTFPQKGLNITVEPSRGTETRSSGSATTITAAVPPTGAIDLRWQKAVTDESSGPTKIYMESENLLTLSEGTAHARWTLNYNILHRPTRDLRVLIPEGWTILGATGEGLGEWKMIDSAQGPTLDLELAYARKGPVQIAIEAERAVGDKEDVLEAPRLRPVGVERESGTLGLEAKGSVELGTQDPTGLTPIDPQELPATLWQAATQPILFAFRYTKPYSLSISVKRHPDVAVLTTTIDNANAVTLMTSRGQMMTRVRYDVRNHLKQYLAIRLPPGAQLWSAFVAGEPVKPTRFDNGSYRIPLAKSQISGNGMQGFPVEIGYYLPETDFWMGGYRSAIFPVPDAPISRAFWSMYLPDRYRFLHFGGDMEKGEPLSPLNAVIGASSNLREEMGVRKAESAQAKEKPGLQRLAMKMGIIAKSMPESPSVNAGAVNAVERQSQMEDEVLENKPQPLTEGVFPIAFDVPTTGQLFHFGQVMLVGQSPRVTMFFLQTRLIEAVQWLLFTSLLGVLYRRRLFIRRLYRAAATRIHPLLWIQIVCSTFKHGRFHASETGV